MVALWLECADSDLKDLGSIPFIWMALRELAAPQIVSAINKMGKRDSLSYAA